MRQPIAGAFELTRATQRTHLDQTAQITPGCGSRRPGQRPVLAGRQSANKPVYPCAHQAHESLFLPRIELAKHAVPQPRVRQ